MDTRGWVAILHGSEANIWLDSMASRQWTSDWGGHNFLISVAQSAALGAIRRAMFWEEGHTHK
eukprot:scaffold316257_cov32-Tisochrysis_lutea.AAC.3